MSAILIVDDDPDVAEVFKSFLQADGHTAVTADGGIACLKLLQEVSPDLILLDLMMQPMDGWTTLKSIKENEDTSTIPVVMITGKPRQGTDYEKYAPLYKDYIMKPIRKKELCDMVKKILATTS
jgi:CheY-like chemotaxis protein